MNIGLQNKRTKYYINIYVERERGINYNKGYDRETRGLKKYLVVKSNVLVWILEETVEERRNHCQKEC